VVEVEGGKYKLIHQVLSHQLLEVQVEVVQVEQPMVIV
jgi:hypothetical protein